MQASPDDFEAQLRLGILYLGLGEAAKAEEHLRKGWTRQEGLQMNAEDYMSRPIEAAELVRAVEGTIRRASGEPMGLKEASEYIEQALERINRIEELLVK